MTVNIHGARVRVVGASGNIGDAVADAFAAAGAQVLCPERVALDITDDASVEAYFAVATLSITSSSLRRKPRQGQLPVLRFPMRRL